MSELKEAILDAKYIDMISVADFIVRDCNLPDVDADGNYLPQATDIAAALFRWAAGAEAGQVVSALVTPGGADPMPEPQADQGFDEYDEHGDPIMDAEEAARLEAELRKRAEEKD